MSRTVAQFSGSARAAVNARDAHTHTAAAPVRRSAADFNNEALACEGLLCGGMVSDRFAPDRFSGLPKTQVSARPRRSRICLRAK